MKITRLINTIQNRINVAKVAKKENEINRFVRIHDINTYGDSYKQMCTAKETIANYAKKHGVSVDIYDARRVLDDDCDAPVCVQNNLSDKIHVIVSNMLNGKSKSRFVSANTDMAYDKVATSNIFLPSKAEGTEVVCKTTRKTTDSFLRNLYRNIEDMTKQVTNAKN